MPILQKDVDSLCDWSLKWQIKFTHDVWQPKYIRSQYAMMDGNGKLTDIRHDDIAEKDLGVLFDRKLSFRQHIVSIVKKVNRMIGLTRRTFHCMIEEVYRLLCASLMRLEDCIWSSHQKVDIAQLENAQRRATKCVPDLRDRCYEDRLRALNVPSLLYGTHGCDSDIPYHEGH